MKVTFMLMAAAGIWNGHTKKKTKNKKTDTQGKIETVQATILTKVTTMKDLFFFFCFFAIFFNIFLQCKPSANSIVNT